VSPGRLAGQLGSPRRSVLPESYVVLGEWATEFGRSLDPGRDGADADVLAVEPREPVREWLLCERRRQLGRERFLRVAVLQVRERWSPQEDAHPGEELRLERRKGEMTAVGGRVDPVAREPARQHPLAGVAAEPVLDETVAPMRHRDAQPRTLARARAPDECREHLGDGTERPRREIGDLQRWPRRRVLEHTGPAEVVEIVAGPLRVATLGTESRDRAVNDGCRQVVRADAEPCRDAGAEPFEHHVGPRAEAARECGVGLEVAHDGLLPLAQCPVPRRSGPPERIALRRLDTHDAGAEPGELAARVGDRQVPRQFDHEGAAQWLHVDRHDPYSDRVLTNRSIADERPGRDREAAIEEKRRLIIDAAVRVFARDGYHTSRVGDIAEEAGIAHGLLYHYFSSKEEVLATLFRENWGELLGRLAQVEESDEPADEQLRGIAKILLRSWRNDPDLVSVMVREVARSSHLLEQVDEIRAGFATIQRVIERGQAQGIFRTGIDPQLASWIFYGALEEILTGWVLGQLPDGDEEVARAERTIIDVVCGGLTVRDAVNS